MKEKYIRRLKKLMFNLEGAKALTYYYAGDEYYHRVHTPEHKIRLILNHSNQRQLRGFVRRSTSLVRMGNIYCLPK